MRVNDRGPFGHGVLDLSEHAARIIGLSGWQRVRIEIVSQSRTCGTNRMGQAPFGARPGAYAFASSLSLFAAAMRPWATWPGTSS